MRDAGANGGHPAAANEDLSAFLDGELTDAEAADFEAALSRDPALADALRSLERVAADVRRVGPLKAPAGFADRVMARVEQAHPETSSSFFDFLRKPFGIPLEGWAIGLAAAAALLLALPEAWRPGPLPAQHAVPHSFEPEVSPAALAPHAIEKEQDAEDVADAATAPQRSSQPGKVLGRASTDGGDEDLLTSKPTPAPVPSPAVPAPAAPAAAMGTAEPSTVQVPVPSPQEAMAPPDGSVAMHVVGGPTLKREVLAIAARYGKAADSEGKPITSAGSYSEEEVIKVTLAQSDLAAFSADLATRGYEVKTAPGAGLVRGTLVDVTVTLRSMPLKARKGAATVDQAVDQAAEQAMEAKE